MPDIHCCGRFQSAFTLSIECLRTLVCRRGKLCNTFPPFSPVASDFAAFFLSPAPFLSPPFLSAAAAFFAIVVSKGYRSEVVVVGD